MERKEEGGRKNGREVGGKEERHSRWEGMRGWNRMWKGSRKGGREVGRKKEG